MPENDITKMKVADLKRELKLRGLATSGNKTELQDRLQMALIDGELSLEDTATAISGEDLLDEDGVLTDEDEAQILGDENELLQSPTPTPTPGNLTKLSLTTGAAAAALVDDDEDEVLKSPAPTPPAGAGSAGKKIVLKRRSSLTLNAVGNAAATTDATQAAPAKAVKLSTHTPITMDSGDGGGSGSGSDTSGAPKKVTQLSLQERLDLRAKKFGITTTSADVQSNNVKAQSTTPAAAATTDGGVVDQKQIELLKKRAERFGCVVSPQIAKLDAEEKLQKRKQRFGGADAAAASSGDPDYWPKKALMRLERFKNTVDTPTAVPAQESN